MYNDKVSRNGLHDSLHQHKNIILLNSRLRD